MTDSSSDSDESSGRVQEWEVVSLSTLSLSGSASMCACEMCCSGDGNGGDRSGIGNDAHILCNHFGSEPHMPSMLDQFLGSDKSAELDSEGHRPIRAEGDSERFSGTDVDETQTVVSGKSASQIPEMDWIEPSSPNTENLLRDDGDGESSILYSGSEKKSDADSEYREAVGPLLGSCMSAPSAAAIVSSVAAFRVGLGDDFLQGQIGGDEGVIIPNFVVEAELGGIEREVLGPDPGFESFHGTTEDAKDSKSSGRKLSVTDSPLLDGRYDEQACEGGWKKGVALWYVQARQANTLWSLALAAAVMGLVILGQRWQHESCQNHQLRLQLCSKDEKISQLIFQVARLKDALAGRRRVPVLRSGSSYSFRDRF